MRRIVRKHQPHIITSTEAQPGDSRAVQALLPKYGAYRAGGRMVVWKLERLDLDGKPEYIRLTHVYDDPEGWRDLHVTRAYFNDLANGLRYCFLIPHAAATVENGNSWNLRNPKGVAVHEQGWPLVAWMASRAEAEGCLTFIVGDSNLDQKRDVWRAYLTRQLKRPSVWEGRVPKLGSHGRKWGRLIDTCHTSVKVARAFVSTMPKRWPMDHGVIVMAYDLTAALRRKG